MTGGLRAAALQPLQPLECQRLMGNRVVDIKDF